MLRRISRVNAGLEVVARLIRILPGAWEITELLD
jgi:hypothetical protein